MENMRELFQVMTRRFGILNKRCCATADGQDISLIHSNILHEISRQHNPSIQQVAEVLGQDITTFSRQVQALVDLELVRKTPNPSDRRVQLLSLTEKGQEAADQIDREINLYLEQIFSQMSPYEKEIVVHSLKLLTDCMGRSQMCCTPLG